MRPVALALVATLFAAVPIHAQTYTVKHDGTGDFTDLQVALDSIPTGATLLVYGGSLSGVDYGAIVIRQSVSIIGASDSQPVIGGWTGSNWYDPNQSAPGVKVSAASDSTVVLENLLVVMFDDGDKPTLGIIVDSVGTLVVDRCTVQAAPADNEEPMPVSRVAPSAIFVAGAATIVGVFDSTLIGAKGTDETNVGDDENCHGNGTIIGGPGGSALDVTNTIATIISDSTLTAGAGGHAEWSKEFGCGDSPPIELRGGDGGNAVTGSAFVSNCTLVPGAGGTFSDAQGPDGENGADGVEVSGTRTDLPNNIAVSGPAVIGSSITFAGSNFAPFRVAFIFESLSLAQPFHIRQGDWFLGFPFLLLGATTTDVSGAFSLSGTVPKDPALIGLSLALQFADTDHLSEPTLIIIGQ